MPANYPIQVANNRFRGNGRVVSAGWRALLDQAALTRALSRDLSSISVFVLREVLRSRVQSWSAYPMWRRLFSIAANMFRVSITRQSSPRPVSLDGMGEVRGKIWILVELESSRNVTRRLDHSSAKACGPKSPSKTPASSSPTFVRWRADLQSAHPLAPAIRVQALAKTEVAERRSCMFLAAGAIKHCAEFPPAAPA